MTREIAGWNSSAAQVLFVHAVGVRMMPLLANQAQQARYFREVVTEGKRWGVAASETGKDVMDWSTRATRVEGGYILNGMKHFCTGTEDADYVYVYAILDTAHSMFDGLLTVVVPKGTPGMLLHGDWDAMGQRQTSSGSITFKDCFIADEHILGLLGAQFSIRPSLWALYFQSAFNCLHMGMAEGALEVGFEYCKTTTRPWPSAQVEKAVQDPYIQRTAGRLKALVAAARALTDRSNEAALLAERGLIPRGEGALRIAHAKVITTEVSLEVTSTLFEILGARATYRKNAIDRFWRSARTLTLHDPVQWKLQEIGHFELSGEFPAETFYS